MQRRDFLHRVAQLTKGAAAGAVFSSAGTLVAKEKQPPDLVVVDRSIENPVAQIFDSLGGVDKFIGPGYTVLLKPNLAFANPPKWGSTTDPEIIKTVAEFCLNAGARRVIVLDHTNHTSEKVFLKTGLGELLQGLTDVKLVSLDKETMYTEVTVPNGKALSTIKIAKLIDRADLLINLPCAKSHSGTDVSFGLKNLMGLIWERSYFHNSTDLHAAIAELATVIQPRLTILDATRALVTNGPTGPGKVENLNKLVAGTNPLLVDAYTATLAAWNNRSIAPNSIRHLSHASKIGLGDLDITKCNIQKIGS
ncbi:DUF362 domain-containing protein [bacterium]|nr:DUF362 domain-containing protein [bacterium]